MLCVVCRNGETQPGRTTVTFHEHARTVVVTDVPADVCGNCDEPYVAEDVTARLLEIAVQARAMQAQVLVREFTAET
jgi:YgiT-type zinc finger domain-containing protein